MTSRMATARATRGRTAEDRVRAHLIARGLRPRTRNHHCRFGEIDLIMDDGDTIVFIEVRYRRRRDYGGAAASVDGNKQRKLIRAASDYLARNNLARRPARFDVAAVDPDGAINWIRGAFDAG